MENGSEAELVLHEDGRYEVARMMKSARLRGPSLADIGKTLVELPLSSEGGGSQNYSRIDLV